MASDHRRQRLWPKGLRWMWDAPDGAACLSSSSRAAG